MKNLTRIALALAVALVAAAAHSSTAAAEPGCDEIPLPPACGESEPTEHFWNETLTVSKTAGTITGGGIDCGATCATDVEVSMICTPWDGCGEPLGQTVTLTASPPGSGWSPVWTGCDATAGLTCDVYVDRDRAVSLAWNDVQDPIVTLNAGAAKVGASMGVSGGAADNAGVNRIEYYVDGVKKAQSSAGPGYDATIDMSGYGHGTAHELTARSFDVNGRASALSAKRTVTVDRQVGLTLGGAPAAGGYTNAATAPLTFTTDADVPAGNRKCGIQGGALATCGSPFAPSLPSAGSVTYVVEVTDDVGNKATATRQFTVDRTAPTASFTDGPAEGATVGTSAVTISFTAADASPKSVTCSVDGGAPAACTSATTHTLSGLSDGAHSLTVKVTDAAGNALEIKRTFAVKSVVTDPGTGDPNPNPTPGPNPNPNPTGGPNLNHDPAVDQPFLPLVGHDTSTVGARTKFNMLRARNLPAGSKVKLSCKGPGCPFKSRELRATGGVLNLVKALKGRRLRAGAVLDVRITGPAGEVKFSRYTMRRGKAPRVQRG